MDWHPDIGIDIVERDDMVFVLVEGEVDLYSAPEFEQSLTTAAATDPPSIIVDLDRVSFMDSAGVHVLLQFSLTDGIRNRLALTRGSPQVRRLLDVTGVRRYLSFVGPDGF